jgi:hypothetical protein
MSCDPLTRRASQRATGFELVGKTGPSLYELLAVALIVIGVTLAAAVLR